MNEITKKISLFLLDIVQTVVLALSLFVVCYLFLFQPHVVKGSSMYPNLHDSDFLLTDKISYRLNLPKRGDIIVFKAPTSEPCSESDCEYIKRIIGLPGEQVRLINSTIFINNVVLAESYLPTGLITKEGSYLHDGETVQIPEDEYLAMGDNRPYSRDGREFGVISRKAIVGKAWLRYWPVIRAGIIKNPLTTP